MLQSDNSELKVRIIIVRINWQKSMLKPIKIKNPNKLSKNYKKRLPVLKQLKVSCLKKLLKKAQ